jgi:periplasmic divalent cation tolerance protein
MSDVRLLYVTTKDQNEADRIANALVAERLAACANIFGSIKSVYIWQGKLEAGSEVAMLVKTTQRHVVAAIDRIKALHSYECPAILVLPVLGGNAEFLQWVEAQVQFQPTEGIF